MPYTACMLSARRGLLDRPKGPCGISVLPVHLTLHRVVNTSLKCPLAAVIVMPRTEVTASQAHNNALPISPIKQASSFTPDQDRQVADEE